MYQNSVAVVVLIQPVIRLERGYKVGLLVIQRADPEEDGYNRWAFPGGYVEQEDVRLALAREVREELGLELDHDKLFIKDVQSVPDGSKHLIFFQAPRMLEERIPSLTPSDEVIRVKIIGDINEVQWAFPLHREQAKKFFAGIDK